jgi:hypothetical protein
MACLAMGCGDDSSDGDADPVSDGCRISGALSGGVDHQFGGDAFACSGSGGVMSVGQLLGKGDLEAVFKGGSINLTLRDLSPVPALGQNGPVAVNRVSIEQAGPLSNDSSQPTERALWEFEAGSCMLDVRATFEDPDTEWVWFRAAVECSGAAIAVAPNTKAPVTLSGVMVNMFVSKPL